MPPPPPPPPPRVVTLVLVTPAGELLGSLPPFRAEMPWWPEAWDIVRGAREHFGIEITLLRILETEPGTSAGGEVTYLAETAADAPRPAALRAWAGSLPDHPLRMPWARPGGPAADLAWARAALVERGMELAGAEQIRTWNLSSLWRLQADRGTFWLKVVPPFFAHEGFVLHALQTEAVPKLIAHDGARALLADIPGDDLYGAPLPVLLEMVALLVGIQQRWMGRAEELLALGLLDWRAPALASAVKALVERLGGELPAADRRTLQAFAADLPVRLARVAEAGLPDTLVHGDFHPGNHRGSAGAVTLLDWGDSGVGHPLLDEPAFLRAIDPEHVGPVRERWHALWRAAVPGSDPERAAERLAPVAAARKALIYQNFLDNIEPSEHPYHASDPGEWLSRTVQILETQAG